MCYREKLSQRARGFTLVEVLVAVALLATVQVVLTQYFNQSIQASDRGNDAMQATFIGRRISELARISPVPLGQSTQVRFFSILGVDLTPTPIPTTPENPPLDTFFTAVSTLSDPAIGNRFVQYRTEISWIRSAYETPDELWRGHVITATIQLPR